MTSISLDDKYEDEDYRNLMKSFAAAATEGDLDKLEELLKQGADINGLGEKWTGWTALHHSADSGHAHIVQFLLDNGADKDRITLDYSAFTPLHLAISKRHYQVVDLLVSAGADLEAYTATGCCGTALHLAAAMGDVDLCGSLLKAGADVSAISEEGSTCLHYVCQSQVEEAASIASKLLGNSAPNVDINATDYEGQTALHKAAVMGDKKLVLVLLATGADVTIKEDNFGKTAEKMAEEMFHSEVMNIIREASK